MGCFRILKYCLIYGINFFTSFSFLSIILTIDSSLLSYSPLPLFEVYTDMLVSLGSKLNDYPFVGFISSLF